jgi:hypothetical protein
MRGSDYVFGEIKARRVVDVVMKRCGMTAQRMPEAKPPRSTIECWYDVIWSYSM